MSEEQVLPFRRQMPACACRLKVACVRTPAHKRIPIERRGEAAVRLISASPLVCLPVALIQKPILVESLDIISVICEDGAANAVTVMQQTNVQPSREGFTAVSDEALQEVLFACFAVGIIVATIQHLVVRTVGLVLFTVIRSGDVSRAVVSELQTRKHQQDETLDAMEQPHCPGCVLAQASEHQREARGPPML